MTFAQWWKQSLRTIPNVCARLGEAIAPGMYHVAIYSAFKEPFQSGLGKQQVAILSKYQAQAAWAETWKSMNGIDPPRGLCVCVV